MELLECALIGVSVVIRSNVKFIWLPSYLEFCNQLLLEMRTERLPISLDKMLFSIQKY